MYLENLRHSTTPTSVVAPILAGFRLRPLRLTPLCCPTRFMFYLVDFNNLNNWQQLPRSSALCCVPVAGGLPCVVQRKGLPSRVGFPLPWWFHFPRFLSFPWFPRYQFIASGSTSFRLFHSFIIPCLHRFVNRLSHVYVG